MLTFTFHCLSTSWPFSFPFSVFCGCGLGEKGGHKKVSPSCILWVKTIQKKGGKENKKRTNTDRLIGNY